MRMGRVAFAGRALCAQGAGIGNAASGARPSASSRERRRIGILMGQECPSNELRKHPAGCPIETGPARMAGGYAASVAEGGDRRRRTRHGRPAAMRPPVQREVDHRRGVQREGSEPDHEPAEHRDAQRLADLGPWRRRRGSAAPNPQHRGNRGHLQDGTETHPRRASTMHPLAPTTLRAAVMPTAKSTISDSVLRDDADQRHSPHARDQRHDREVEGPPATG